MNINYDKKFMLHRIAHQWIVSYNLLDKGYLIYGWSELFLDAHKNNKKICQGLTLDEFEKIGVAYYGEDFRKDRRRHNVVKFFNYQIGDYVLIPKYKSFGLYEVIDAPKSIYECDYINDLTQIKTADNRKISFDSNKGLVIEGEEYQIDIGMVVKVKEIFNEIDKDFAPAELQSKFKFQGAFLDLTDYKDIIKRTIENYESGKPISLYASVIESLKNNDWYSELNNPDKLEILIKNLMLKLGADESEVLSKNESGKRDYADCDVRALFNSLGVQYLIQCKNHNGKEQDEAWAIEQITKYANQKAESLQDDITTILWVVSMVENFSEQTKSMATDNGVRLINQKDLLEILINSGWTSKMEYA